MDENQLIQNHLGLVITIVKRFKPKNDFEKQEYVQEGSIALLRAIRKYDKTRGQLSTFAWKYITKAILKYILKEKKGFKLTQLSSDLKYNTSLNSLDDILPNTLTDREKTIIQMRWDGYTFEEIGKKLGCTRGWSNRLFNRGAEKIRTANG